MIESSWPVAVAVHPATHTRAMAAMVVVALVAQTTAVAKEAEGTEDHRAMVEPPVGLGQFLAMVAVAAAVAWDPVVPVQPALATAFPVARASLVKVEKEAIHPILALHSASLVAAVAIMAAVALRVVTAVPAAVVVALLGRARSPIRPSPRATRAMDL